MPRPKKKLTAAFEPFPGKSKASEVPTTKPKLLADSDSEDVQEEGFKINEEYARRFEHNKKREELHRLEEKYGKDSKKPAQESNSEDPEDDSDSEEEDDTAVLATEKLDQEISATLAAIRSRDPRVYDGKTTFFTPIEEEEIIDNGEEKAEKGKPMFLRDYHRMNLLSGKIGDEEEGEAGRTFAQEQEELKRTVVKEMHAAAEDGNGEEDDGFLVRKLKQEDNDLPALKPTDLPDPATADPNNPDEYLNAFLNSRVWSKTTDYPTLLSDDSEEEEKTEAFEHAYNFRFEDPDAHMRGQLVSYGRDTILANTVRREEKSGRKKAREEKRARKQREKEERERERGRLKKLKTEELMEKFKLIREAAGIDGEEDAEVEAEVLEKLLERDWSDREWEKWMTKKFNDSYYEQKEKGGKIKKPMFDDDIDIGDIVPDFDKGGEGEDDEKDAEIADVIYEEGEDEDEQLVKNRKRKRELLKEKKEKKQKDKEVKRKIERLVDENYDFEDLLPASSTAMKGFRYRETTPESFGLTMLDILAAEDADLNSYVGLKKLASFREAEKKRKDKKKFGKKKRLREWRKEVFGDEEGIKMPENWKPQGLGKGMSGDDEKKAGKVDIVDNGGDGERKKKRRRKAKS